MKKSKSLRTKATTILASKDQDVLSLLSTLVERLASFETKMDSVLKWVNSQSASKPFSSFPRPQGQTPRPMIREEHRDPRPMYKAVCADCRSLCQIPFKPSGDRPVYCQECFRARKNNNLPDTRHAERPRDAAPAHTKTRERTRPDQ